MKKSLIFCLTFQTLNLLAQPYQLIIKNTAASDTAGVMDLYIHSGNQRTVSVINTSNDKPEKGFNIIPSQGEIRKNGLAFYFYPSGPEEMKIAVQKKNHLLGEVNFKVIAVPDPETSFSIQDKNTILSHGFMVKMSDTVSVKFRIDSLYSKNCPRDITYKASEITVVRNGNVRNPMKVNGSFQLKSFGLQSGETIKLELNKYKRINFEGKEFESDAEEEDYVILKVE